MDYNWTQAYLLSLPHVEQDFKVEWNAQRYLLAGKMFAMRGGDKEGRPIITLKLEPLFSDLLRQQYPGRILPGYYMNKTHWSSLYLTEDCPAALEQPSTPPVPDPVVEEMIAQAHRLVLESLSAKQRRLLEEGSPA